MYFVGGGGRGGWWRLNRSYSVRGATWRFSDSPEYDRYPVL